MSDAERMELEHRIRDLERELADTRARAESDRAELEKTLRFLDNLPQPVFEIDENGRFSYANRNGFMTYGYSMQDVGNGLNVFDLIIPEDRAIAAKMIPGVISGGEKSGTECRVVTKTGEIVPVIIYSVPVITMKGVPGLQGIVVDISGAKHAEEALRQSDELFRMLIDSVPGISIQGYDTDGIVRYWNKASELVYGYTAGEAMGRNLGDLVVPADLRPLFDQCLVVGKTLTRSGEFMPSGELILKHKNGSPVPVFSIHTAVCAEGREPLMFCLDVDLSERKRIEADLRQRAERAQHLQAVLLDLAKGSFPDTPSAVRRILEIAANELDVERTSLWWYNPADMTLVCEEVCSRNGDDTRDRGMMLDMHGHRDYRLLIEKNRVVPIDTVSDNPIIDGPIREYLQERGITSFLLVPVWLHGEFIGVLNHEHTGAPRTWPAEEQQFAASVADIISLAREGAERRAAEEALRASEKRYREIFDTIPVSVWEYDFGEALVMLDQYAMSGIEDLNTYFAKNPGTFEKFVSSLRLVDVNRETVLMYGAKSKEEIFQAYGHHRIRETADAYYQIASQYIAGKTLIRVETTNETFDGRRIDIVLQISVTEETRRSGRALVTVLNVTDQKNAEKALRASEEKFRSIVEQSTDGITLVDEEGIVIEWNPAMDRITGITRTEAIGTPIWDLISRTMAERKKAADRILRYRDYIHEIIRTGAIPPHMRFMEVTIRRADGSHRIIQQAASPVKTGRGHTLIITTRDVTEFKRIEEERMKAGKLESVGLLAGGIAHDFNNILVSILGHISLAKSCLDPTNPTTDLLRKAENAGFQARDLTRQLLTFSKGGSPVKEAESIAEIIREAVEFSLRGSNVRCEFSLPDDLADADVDRGQMSQVMNNLILNAWQAMPDGGVIFISASNVSINGTAGLPLETGEYVCVTVRDTGTGIAPDVLPRIFDPYFTTKHDGSGLGLATTYSIVKNHGGHISVASEEGVGTTFNLYVPAAQETLRSRHEAKSRPPDILGRVLVMDDEAGVREVVEAMLHHIGHEAETVSDGETALVRYREALESGTPFDVVIMDLTVPGGMGGKAAVRELLTIDPSALAIVSSGYSGDSILAEYAEYGFSGVIAKPYRLEDLREELNRVMSGKRKQ